MTTAKRTRIPPEQRRRQLLEVATRLFVSCGAGNVSTRAVADAAGVSEGLVFHVFGTKEELFEQAVLQPLEQLISKVTEICTELVAMNPAERTTAGYTAHRAILAAMIDLTPLLGAAIYTDPRQGERFFRSDLAPLLERVDRSVAVGLGGWRHRAGVDPSLVSSLILGSYNWIAMRGRLSGEPVDVERTAKDLADILMIGLTPRTPDRKGDR